jgi:hypothetical protein
MGRRIAAGLRLPDRVRKETHLFWNNVRLNWSFSAIATALKPDQSSVRGEVLVKNTLMGSARTCFKSVSRGDNLDVRSMKVARLDKQMEIRPYKPDCTSPGLMSLYNGVASCENFSLCADGEGFSDVESIPSREGTTGQSEASTSSQVRPLRGVSWWRQSDGWMATDAWQGGAQPSVYLEGGRKRAWLHVYQVRSSHDVNCDGVYFRTRQVSYVVWRGLHGHCIGSAPAGFSGLHFEEA